MVGNRYVGIGQEWGINTQNRECLGYGLLPFEPRTGVVSAGNTCWGFCGKDGGKLLCPFRGKYGKNEFSFICWTSFSCSHSFLNVVPEFDIEHLVIWVSGEEAAFRSTEKTTVRVVGVVYQDASWTRVFDDSGDDELIIKAAA